MLDLANTEATIFKFLGQNINSTILNRKYVTSWINENALTVHIVILIWQLLELNAIALFYFLLFELCLVTITSWPRKVLYCVRILFAL